MRECANLFGLIPGINVESEPDTPPPEQVLGRLHKLGLSVARESRVEARGIFSRDWPLVAAVSDRQKLLERLHRTDINEYLIVDSDDCDQSLLGIRSDDGDPTSRWQHHELGIAEGISGLCQCFLQRTAIEFQSDRNYVVSQNLVGVSDSFQATLDLTTKVATLDAGVYINGETGTGKELVARSIHYLSERREHPFVAVNCGAFNDELILSELFGHSKGAFTGADSSRVGLIEQAEGGTLLLDEIDCLSKKAQIILLRYLQEKEFRPVGSNTVKNADVRVIAASNTPLEDQVRTKRFREDLFYRLDILRINVPALRERGPDRQLLSQFFLRRMTRELHAETRVLDPSLIASIDAYSWPGNIRQLENSLYRVFLLTDGFTIKSSKNIRLHEGDRVAGPVPAAYSPHADFRSQKAEVIRRFEKNYLCDVLSRTKGNVSKAARLARKDRTAFIRLMRKYGLEREAFSARPA